MCNYKLTFFRKVGNETLNRVFYFTGIADVLAECYRQYDGNGASGVKWSSDDTYLLCDRHKLQINRTEWITLERDESLRNAPMFSENEVKDLVQDIFDKYGVDMVVKQIGRNDEGLFVETY